MLASPSFYGQRRGISAAVRIASLWETLALAKLAESPTAFESASPAHPPDLPHHRNGECILPHAAGHADSGRGLPLQLRQIVFHSAAIRNRVRLGRIERSAGL